MTTCTRCGHTVETGRFCAGCGEPAAAQRVEDTAERPAVPAPPLPPAPSAARYPLFADEVPGGADEPPTVVAGRPAPPLAPPLPPATAPRSHRGGGGWLVWVALAAVLVVVALVGATLLLAGGGDEEQADDAAGSPSSAPARSGDSSAEPAPSPSPPSQSPTAEPGEPTDVARSATARVPATAPQGTDVDGDRIAYDAAQMLDGDPQTCWRMSGDGTGEEIVLSLEQPTLVSELGLVNGYAKTAQDARGRDLDWYAGNRRVLAVEWVLDDGTVVEQELDETRGLQTVEIDPVETSTVVLRLVEVSEPGRGRASRDNTAISELSVVGSPR